MPRFALFSARKCRITPKIFDIRDFINMTEETLVLFSDSERSTELVGENLARRLCEQNISFAFIALYGEMGVGKTAFTRGFCHALGIKSVHSPTYTVVNEYAEGSHPVFHFDMYRICGEDDLYSIGYEEYLLKEGYILCEWSENITPFLPRDAITVTINREGDGSCRRITIQF